MQEIQLSLNGVDYTAEFVVDEDDTLTVFLPDGSSRQTVLRGMRPRSAAMTHLQSFAQQCQRG